MARLHEHYQKTVVPALMEKFEYSSVMQVPRITKITLNMGVGEAVTDKKVMASRGRRDDANCRTETRRNQGSKVSRCV